MESTSGLKRTISSSQSTDYENNEKVESPIKKSREDCTSSDDESYIHCCRRMSIYAPDYKYGPNRRNRMEEAENSAEDDESDSESDDGEECPKMVWCVAKNKDEQYLHPLFVQNQGEVNQSVEADDEEEQEDGEKEEECTIPNRL